MHIEFDAILFDMDGTLVDSTAIVERTWLQFATSHGLEYSELVKFAHGRPTAETVSHFLADRPLATAETLRITSIESTDTEGIVPLPGAAALIAQLRDVHWAVVTSAGRDVAIARMSVAGLPIPSVLVTPEDIISGKPSPDGYLAAARLLGFDITRCLVFEDAGPGIAAGRESGARVVVVGGYSGPESEGLDRIPHFDGAAIDSGTVLLPNAHSVAGIATLS